MAKGQKETPTPRAGSPRVTLWLGPARSGKTHELLRQYREVLRQCSPLAPREERFSRSETATLDRTLWLAPNERTAAIIRGQLLEDGLTACFSPGVVTFERLTERIVADAPQPVRRLPRVAERELLRRAVEHALSEGELTFFAEAGQRPGFIDLLSEHIRELQRANIAPAAYGKATPPHGDARQHRELALLYADYVRQLEAHRLCDVESIYAAACSALASGACRRFQSLQLVVADGFTDFTRTQHELLRLLAQRTERLQISLPAESPVGWAPPTSIARDDGGRCPPYVRSELFAKVAHTLDELQRYHPRLEIQRLSPRATNWPALDHVSQNIFGHPARIPPPTPEAVATLDRLEIVEAAGAHDEVVQLARRIKRLLTPLPRREGQGEGSALAKPGDIVVVFRSLTDAAPRVREVFEQFGIPYSLASPTRLVSSPLMKTLLALLRLDDEDWPFRRVVAAVTNNTLTALDDASRQAAEWLVRALQIAEGREALLQRVRQLASDSAASTGSEHAERRTTRATAALPALAQLAAALDDLPREATPNEWCADLARAGAALGLAPFDSRGRASPRRECESRRDSPTPDDIAWDAIVAHFAALERLDAWLGEPPRKLSRRELLRALVDVASHESLPLPHDEAGRVRVLDAQAARTVCAKHLFLAGMSEQAFPSPERVGRLATDADYRFFARVADQNSAGTHTPPATRAQEEMLLFYEVLSRAEQSLTISFPALDDKAQSLPPSPYVTEVERTLGDEAMMNVRRAKPQLGPVPLTLEGETGRRGDGEKEIGARISPSPPLPVSPSGIYSPSDWRVQAVAQALDGDPRLLSGVFASADTKPAARAIDAGIRIVHARARGESFGPAEGVLASPAAAERLAARFGPKHTWSPSRWETYATCPYRFFVENVLRLEPLGDLVLETDFARRGSRLHDVLAAFHRQWSAVRGARSFTPEEEAIAFGQYLRDVIDERIPVSARAGIDAALMELDRRQIRQWAEAHYDQHGKYDAACSKLGASLTPTHFEFRFGPPRPGDEQDPDSIADAFVLEIDGEQIRVTGQIDRIDVGEIDGRKVFNVIDYKSGRKVGLKREQLESGEKLQLPIYVEAAQVMLFKDGAMPLVAGYWSMAAGFDAKGALAVVQDGNYDAHWKIAQENTRRLVGRFVQAIRRGEFPVFSRDDKCTSYCDFNTICRVGHSRSLNKIWQRDEDGGQRGVRAQRSGDP